MKFSLWLFRMLVDVVRYGVVNRSMAMSLSILALHVVALAVVAAHVSAPFIYTLF